MSLETLKSPHVLIAILGWSMIVLAGDGIVRCLVKYADNTHVSNKLPTPDQSEEIMKKTCSDGFCYNNKAVIIELVLEMISLVTGIYLLLYKNWARVVALWLLLLAFFTFLISALIIIVKVIETGNFSILYLASHSAMILYKVFLAVVIYWLYRRLYTPEVKSLFAVDGRGIKA